jgi:aspartate racemase
VVADPDARVSRLRLLPEAERTRMVEEWGRTEGRYPQGLGIVRVFAEVARARSAATALSCGSQTMSYGELDRRSAQCARYLRLRGVQPGSVVGLSVDRSFELIVGMLGIVKAGGAYCPLEENNPDARLSSMMKEARVSTVVTMSSQAGRLRSLGAEVVCLDSGWGEIGREEATDPGAEVTGSSLAYAMYTSGSTGQPKCVGVPHDAVVRLVRDVTYVHLGPEEVLLQYAPVSFDASTFEIWGALLNGGKLVIMPAGRYSLEEVGSVVQSTGVTTLWLTAALFHHMVDGPLEFFGGVRQLLAGGEVLSVGHVQKFARRYPQCTLINGYGPTENTTFTCCYTVKDPEGLGGSVPIGRPVNATHVYILDGHLQPVPVGVPGELYIGGDGLATGYLHQPSLTAERFIADPYRVGERMYRSGDRVRYRADGNIEFLGRMDAQVKLRGYRIEPGEIEAVLAEEETVKESVVLMHEDAAGEKSLVAYLTARPGRTIAREAVEKFVRSRLPEYMVPAAWVVLERFPVTPTGKIDRNDLPDPVAASGAATPDENGGGNPTENALAQIWARLLPGRTIDRKKSFFEQGGHSLLAMQLASRIMEVFQIRLSLATLFEHPSIPSQALFIEEKLTEELENMDDGGSPVGGDHS